MKAMLSGKSFAISQNSFIVTSETLRKSLEKAVMFVRSELRSIERLSSKHVHSNASYPDTLGLDPVRKSEKSVC